MAFTAAAVASAIAVAYPLVESILRERNSKKASKLRKELEQVLSQYNLKLDDLRKDLELRGIKYNQLNEALAYASPVGRAGKMKRQAEADYRKDVDTINKKIADTTNQMNQYSALENKRISDTESKGVMRTILGDKI